jgi:hypothetical protein
MVSPHLQAEHERLLETRPSHPHAGSVAPLNVWISPAPKGEHLYYKLSSKNPEYKNQHLGKAGSESIATGEPEFNDEKRSLNGAATLHATGPNRSSGKHCQPCHRKLKLAAESHALTFANAFELENAYALGPPLQAKLGTHTKAFHQSNYETRALLSP